MDYREEYRRKLISAEEAARLVKSDMWVDYGAILSFPYLIDEELAKRAASLQRVKIRGCLALKEPAVLKADRDGEHFIYNEWHFSKVSRMFHDQGCCSYIPYNLGEGPVLYRGGVTHRPDVAFMEVTPMDGEGFFNFGTIEKNKAVCDMASTVVVEVNQSMPWIMGGYDERIHVSEVDFVVENDRFPVGELVPSTPTKVERLNASQVAEIVEDGSTIQLGIGGLPNEVGRLLIKRGVKDLGIHTEMFTEGMMEMFEAGTVTNRMTNLNASRAVCTFFIGSRKLYDFIDHNPAVAGFPVDYTNDPTIISQHRNMVAINSAVEVDLQGQVSSESHGYRHISGTGGQLQFVRGAHASTGGKAVICLPSTFKSSGGKVRSRITAGLSPGTVVTVPRTDVSWIATEFGMVNLKGMVVWERAKALISIAHTDFRAELEEQARRFNIIPKGIFVLLIAIILGLASCQSSTDPIKIGAIYNLEGAQASLDIPSANGAKLAVKEMNASGGVRGRTVELILYDGKTDQATIEKAARDLVEKDMVRAIVGFSDTDMVLYAAPIAARDGVVFMTSGATSPRLPEQVKDFLFLAAFSDDAQAEAAAQYAFNQLRFKTAYIMSDSQMEYTRILRDHFRAAYLLAGGSGVGEDRFETGSRDFSTQIGKFKQLRTVPDVLYIASGPDDIGPIVKQFREAGITQPIFGGDAYDTPLLAETAGPGADNIYFTTHAFLDEGTGTEPVRKFIAAYRAEYGKDPENAFAALGYDSVMLLANGIQKGHGDDPRSILVGLGLTRDFPGVTGNISYEGGSRIPRKDITIISIKKGRSTLAARVTPQKSASIFYPQHIH